MARRAIRIRNIKNISELGFDLPAKGAWLLTAENGSGKTTLLACMRRIGYSLAFSVHFPTSLVSERLDNHEEASITYFVDGEEVEYGYRGERWTPRPRRNGNLLRRFGYPEVIYIGANADRITPRQDDFIPRRVRAAPTDLIQSVNSIFETRRFDRLCTINLTTGRGNTAYLMKNEEVPAGYHSEKQFSLGELCIIKLVAEI